MNKINFTACACGKFCTGNRKPITPYDLYKIIRSKYALDRWSINSTHDFQIYNWIEWARSPDGVPVVWLNFNELDNGIKVCPFLVYRGFLKESEMSDPYISKELENKDRLYMCGIYKDRLYNCKSYPLKIGNEVEEWSNRYGRSCVCHSDKDVSTEEWIDDNDLVAETFMAEQWYKVIENIKGYTDEKISDILMVYFDWDFLYSTCNPTKFDLGVGESASKLLGWKEIWGMLQKWEHGVTYSTPHSFNEK